jgi:hypothetical protein
MIKHSRRPVATGGALLAAMLACVAAIPWSDTQAQASAPSIDPQLVDSGAKPLGNSCYRLSGVVGQPVPGYSSSATYSISAGFMAVTPTTNRDEIFFNGFEGC